MAKEAVAPSLEVAKRIDRRDNGLQIISAPATFPPKTTSIAGYRTASAPGYPLAHILVL